MTSLAGWKESTNLYNIFSADVIIPRLKAYIKQFKAS